MKIIKIKNNKLDKKIVQEVLEVLKNNGVIVYPTDTAYALGGVFDSKVVIKKILKIKKRKDKKFTLIASSLFQVEKFFKLNQAEKKLAKKFWPGPLSIVVSKKYAVRVPKNKVAQELAKKIGKPLIATSANISGRKLAYDIKEVLMQFKKNKPNLILDVGKIKKVKPSTVVLVKYDKLKILRKGNIKIGN